MSGTPTRLVLALDGVVFAGAERYVEVLLAGLQADGVEALVLVPADAEPQLAERLSYVARVEPVAGLRRRPDPRAGRALRAAVRRFGADVIHLSLTDQGDGLGLLAATTGLGRPVVSTLHNAIPHRAAWREAVSASALRRSTLVLAVSHAVGEYVTATGARCVVVHNGLAAVPQVPDARAGLGLPAVGDIVGGVGRLREQKAWEVLGVAAERLVQRPDTQVVILGDGEEREQLQRYPALTLLGARPDADAHMSAFTVLAVPSRFEAFGLVAVEAMHAGVPVVASNVGGLPEVVGDAGVLVPPEDPGALADALIVLLEDPVRRAELARAGRARAGDLFTPEAMVRGTLVAYRSVLA